jgi:hypothetical protein
MVPRESAGIDGPPGIGGGPPGIGGGGPSGPDIICIVPSELTAPTLVMRWCFEASSAGIGGGPDIGGAAPAIVGGVTCMVPSESAGPMCPVAAGRGCGAALSEGDAGLSSATRRV